MMRSTLLSLLLAGCFPSKDDDQGLVCGEGTHEEDGACVADSPVGDSSEPTGEGEGETGGEGEGEGEGETGGEGEGEGEGETGGEGEGEGEGETGGEGEGEGDTGTTTEYTVCDDGVAPYDNLQDAIDDAREGDTITVCAGTWAAIEIETGGVNLIGVDGADSTFIQGSASEPAVLIDGETVGLTGFTLQGRLSSGASASALSVTNADVTMESVNVEDSTGTHPVYVKGGILEWDGGVFANNESIGGITAEGADAVTVRHLVIRDNVSTSYALIRVYSSPAVLENLVVHGNTAPNMLVYFYTAGDEVRLANTVFYDNAAVSDASPSYLVDGDGGSFQNSILVSNSAERLISPYLSMSYLDYHGNTASVTEVSGTGNITSDPDLADAASGDFRLESSSPCIDAGNPSSSYDDADGTRNDIGAYGGPSGDW